MTESWGRIAHDVGRDGVIVGANLIKDLVDGTAVVAVLRNLLPESVLAANRKRLAPVCGRASPTQHTNSSLTTGFFFGFYDDELAKAVSWI
ncbi:hypothetical protein [Streptomyces lunalinharesii]|uniref:Uncharacterized protein n=1 Tax=Streptomyces lunalinharesii TaxID=333384 RepID=A0ABN3SY09_9ACTN